MRRRALALALLASLAAARPARGQELYRLTPDPPKEHLQFGWGLAAEGELLAVGAPDHGKKRSGLWLVRAATGGLVRELQPHIPAIDDQFGWSVAISGGLVAVGAPDRYKHGEAYVFDAASGDLLRILTEVEANRRLGDAIAVDGGAGVVVVADPRYVDPVLAAMVGAVHVFDVATGQELHRFTGPPPPDDQSHFGQSVAVGGGRVMVGVPLRGTVYVYDLASGLELHRLEVGPPLQGYAFGTDVAIEGDLGLVGSPVNSGMSGGSAHVFDLASGQELRVLQAPEMRWDNRFGASVDLRGGRAAVGAPGLGDEAQSIAAAYVFDAATGELLQRVTPGKGKGADLYGASIALADGVLAVGAPMKSFEKLYVGQVHAYCGVGPLGRSYCGPAAKNSTGASAEIHASGCDIVRANVLGLEAAQLPPHQLGLFLASLTPGFVPFFGGSQGHLCLGGTFGRVSAPLDSGAFGTLTLSLDLEAFPPPLPPAVQAGETWYFQAFFRDRNPGPTSNLTDGLEVAFR